MVAGLERSHKLQVQCLALGADRTMLQTQRNRSAFGGGHRTTEHRGHLTNWLLLELVLVLVVDVDVELLEGLWLMVPQGQRNRGVLGGATRLREQSVHLTTCWRCWGSGVF